LVWVIIKKGENMGNAFAFFVAVLALSALASAAILGTIQEAASQLCLNLKSLIPVVAMMMLVLGGVIYAAGQMMGAETRARANVWATAALTGALIAIMMAVVGPAVLNIIYPNSAFTGPGC
jgi:hypothetical protein